MTTHLFLGVWNKDGEFSLYPSCIHGILALIVFSIILSFQYVHFEFEFIHDLCTILVFNDVWSYTLKEYQVPAERGW